jgi:hypothetical protein
MYDNSAGVGLGGLAALAATGAEVSVLLIVGAVSAVAIGALCLFRSHKIRSAQND